MYHILFIVFFSFILCSDNLKIDTLSIFNNYENILKNIYNQDESFIQINSRLQKIKPQKINLNCSKNKTNSIVISLNNEEYVFSRIHLYKENDYNRLFMILAVNSFLFGNSTLSFDYYDYDKFDSSLFRKGKMLEHLRNNYNSFLSTEFKVLYEDSVSTVWLKNTEKEFIIFGLNNSEKNKQVIIDLTELKPQYALGLLDRSMLRFEDGKTYIDFTKYQTRIFNLKR